MSDHKLDTCEWNPDEGRPTRDGEHHAYAVWSVGSGRPNWHLCESCAALPKFKRFTRRVWIGGVDDLDIEEPMMGRNA